MATNLTGRQVKTLCSDDGGEYVLTEFKKYLKEKGILHQTTTTYNPAQNGVAERNNCTIVETARSKMPVEFWAEAVSTAVYLHSCSPTTSLKDVTPHKCLFHQKTVKPKSIWMSSICSHPKGSA